VMEVLFSLDASFVFHGGTCIWRCHSGCRFSEDLDLYLPKLPAGFEEALASSLSSRGLSVSKFKQTESLVFCKIQGPEAEMRVEINFSKCPPSVPVPYEKMDGSLMIVNAISLSELIIEKAHAYLGRRFIRDIYDVYFLSAGIGDKKTVQDQRTARELASLIRKFQPPADEPNLAAIVYSGAAPSFSSMLEALKRRFG